MRTHNEMAALKHSTKLHKILYVRYKQAQAADDDGEKKMELRVGSCRSVCSVRGANGSESTRKHGIWRDGSAQEVWKRIQ